jgi:hypothetical protein
MGVLLLLPLAVFTPLAFLEHGTIRWAEEGAAAATGFWLVVIVTLVMSGATAQIMGVVAESWTVDELRSSRKSGWHLVNGLKLRAVADIDHVLVGPTGIVVLDTKWSADAWPTGAGESSFMANRLNNAVQQVHDNSVDVSLHFKAKKLGASVRAAVVVWSPMTQTGLQTFAIGDVTVIPGPALRTWLAATPQGDLEQDTVRQVWIAIARHADSRDRRDVAEAAPPQATLWQIFLRWVIQPFSGVLASIYLLALTYRGHRWPIGLGGTVLVLAIGLAALRIPMLRRTALAWTAVASLSAAVLLVGAAVAILQ